MAGAVNTPAAVCAGSSRRGIELALDLIAEVHQFRQEDRALLVNPPAQVDSEDALAFGEIVDRGFDVFELAGAKI